MLRKPMSTADAPSAIGPYSQGVHAQGTLLYLSGQIPLKPDGSLVVGTIQEQTEQAMSNVVALLESQGLNAGNIVKTTVFLSSMDLFQEMNAVYAGYFTGEPPARSTIAVAGLPRGVDIEIEAIAVY